MDGTGKTGLVNRLTSAAATASQEVGLLPPLKSLLGTQFDVIFYC